MHAAIETASLRLEWNGGSGILSLFERATGNLVFEVPAPLFLRPWIDGAAAEPGVVRVEAAPDRLLFRYGGGPEVRALDIAFSAVPEEDAIDLSGSLTTARAGQLNRIDLLPAETRLNLFDLVNFRNRHHTAATWPELPLGGAGCHTDTYSGDWQFAPHPTALLLRANDAGLFCGAVDETGAFGFRFAAKDYALQEFSLDYGAAPHGRPLAAGETLRLPRFRFFLRRDREWTPESFYAAFGAMLVRSGEIADPAEKRREAWWRAPLYCTWIDQVHGADVRVPDALQDQAAAVGKPVRRIDEALVRRAAQVIVREKLPFRTILLDEGWEVARGQWEPHPARFPNLRGLVDELHAAGFKVVVWWNWAEVAAEAEADPAHLFNGGRPNRHGLRVRDYSDPRTQEEYLKPLFRRLFSSEPGCLDLDGVKTDFLADKVHPDLPPRDPAWRGEENYFVRVTRLLYAEMKRHKPDAVHIGGAGHHRLAEYIDINRTYDVHDSNWLEHENRARMLLATTPGCPVAYDFHNYTENLDRWFESARALGASVQVGNLLWTKKDRFADVLPADAAYWEFLRRMLALDPFRD